MKRARLRLLSGSVCRDRPGGSRPVGSGQGQCQSGIGVFQLGVGGSGVGMGACQSNERKSQSKDVVWCGDGACHLEVGWVWCGDEGGQSEVGWVWCGDGACPSSSQV